MTEEQGPSQEDIDDLLAQADQAFNMSMDNLRALGNKLLAILHFASRTDPEAKVDYNKLQGAIGAAKTKWSLILAVKDVAASVRRHMERLRKRTPFPAPKKPRPETDTGLPRPGDD